MASKLKWQPIGTGRSAGSGGAGAGDVFSVVETEARAREVAEYRERKARENQAPGPRAASLDQMMKQLKDSDVAEIALVVKGDVQGSVKPLRRPPKNLARTKLPHAQCFPVWVVSPKATLRWLRHLMPLSWALTRANAQARSAAEAAGIEIRYYNVIYDLVDDLKAAMAGLLSPDLRETPLGTAEILEVFSVSKTGKVAGCRVREGLVRRGASVRLIRDEIVIREGELVVAPLQRRGEGGQCRSECGMAFENYSDLKQGDVIECYEVEEIARSLTASHGSGARIQPAPVARGRGNVNALPKCWRAITWKPKY